MEHFSKTISRPSSRGSQGHTHRQPETRLDTRLKKLIGLLANATAIENGLTLPDTPARYVALEQSVFGDTLWAYFDDLMTGIMQHLEASETSFVERIRVHDLDTDLVYAPKWVIDSLYDVPS